MKKLFAAILALCLMLSVAAAETVDTITWDAVEGNLADMGLTGDFYALEVLGLKIWIPTGLDPQEVPEEDAAAGRLAMFTAEDGSYLVVDAGNVEGMTIDGLLESTQAAEGLTDVEMVIANGLSFVIYRSEELNCWSASLVDTNSNVINFLLGPAEDGSKEAFSVIVASIQPV